jgi:hypothetical protein
MPDEASGRAAIALSSRNAPGVRAIIIFAAGRGGHIDGKPNNNCALDKIVAATGSRNPLADFVLHLSFSRQLCWFS